MSDCNIKGCHLLNILRSHACVYSPLQVTGNNDKQQKLLKEQILKAGGRGPVLHLKNLYFYLQASNVFETVFFSGS